MDVSNFETACEETLCGSMEDIKNELLEGTDTLPESLLSKDVPC